jgi:uncharacterized protein (TIGR00730 family)
MADDVLRSLLDDAGATRNRDVLLDILRTSVALAGDDTDRLDLKITAAALAEMREAFIALTPYRDVPKVTIFGSARTLPDDPLYAQARDVAASLAARGWMVITGAGPGIMEAGFEGAGPDKAIGVSIRLPFEEGVSDPSRVATSVAMKYFFTRKLMLVKESSGFVCLPGGFGTQDETFELCTLLQTGKTTPVPVVLLDVPGGTYWRHWERFLREELTNSGLTSPEDHGLFLVTDDAEAAAREIEGFWRNYDSIRWVGDQLVVRLRAAPTDDELAGLNDRFADLLTGGRIERTEPLPAERSTRDVLDLPRLVLRFNPRHSGRLRAFIDALNRLPTAPADSHVPASPTEDDADGQRLARER